MTTRVIKIVILTTVIVLLTNVFPGWTVGASTSSSEDGRILFNNTVIARPKLVTVNGILYIPIYYTKPLVRRLGYIDVWNGNLHLWSFSRQSSNQWMANPSSNLVRIYVEGKLVCGAPSLQRIDPNSGHSTTYLPLDVLEKVVSSLGFDAVDYWDQSKEAWILSNEAQ